MAHHSFMPICARHCGRLLGILFICLVGALSGPTMSGAAESGPLAAGPAGRTFTCHPFGYTLQIPSGWRVKDGNCNKRVTPLLTSDKGDAVVGVVLAGTGADVDTFQQRAAHDLNTQLGAQPSKISYAWQQLGKIRYIIALYASSAQNGRSTVSAYLAGTEQYGIKYAFEGYTYSRLRPATDRLLLQMRDIYTSIRFFKGTSFTYAAVVKQVKAMTQAAAQKATPASSDTTPTVIAVLALTGVCIAVFVVIVLNTRSTRGVNTRRRMRVRSARPR